MNEKYNISIVPFSVSLVLLVYVFLSLCNTGYYFEWPILLTCFIIVFCWLFVVVCFEIKHRNHFAFIRFNILTFFVGLFLGVWYVKKIWFGGYLNVDPLSILFRNNVHSDTLYHTSFAQGFLNYGIIGYFDGNIAHYHILSHLFVAILSKMLALPCFFTYNYLFHIIFIPIYLFLLQSVMMSFRHYIGSNSHFSVYDLFFLVVFVLGFNVFNMANIGACDYSSIIDSESCLFSLVVMLFAFNLFFLLVKNKRFTNLIVYDFFISIFIIIISGAKISTGVIFYLICCYVKFRVAPCKFCTWVSVFVYSVFLFISYILFSRSGEFSRSVTSSSVSNFSFAFFNNFLAYPRKYVAISYWPWHYMYYCLPSIIIFKNFVKEKIFTKAYFSNLSNIYFEIPTLITFLSFLPGFFMDIVGGSASYFVFPIYIISYTILWAFDFHSAFFIAHSKWRRVIYSFVIFGLLYPQFIESDIKGTFLYALKSGNDFTSINGKFNKIKHCFEEPELKNDLRYKIIEDIYDKTRRNESLWGLVVEDDSLFSKDIVSKALDLLLISGDDYVREAKLLGRKHLIILSKQSYSILNL